VDRKQENYNPAGALDQQFLKTKNSAGLGELKRSKHRFVGGLMSVYEQGGKAAEQGANMAKTASAASIAACQRL
jgi:hypothetical protein